MSRPDVLERIAAANPVPTDAPPPAWTAAVLLDEIDSRRGQMTKLKPVRRAQTSEGRRRAPRSGWTVAAATFVTVVVIVGIVALWPDGGPTPTAISPAVTTTSEVTSATASPTSASEPAPDPALIAQTFVEASSGAEAVALLAPDVELEGFPWPITDLAAAIDWQASFVDDTFLSCDLVAPGPPAEVNCSYETDSPLGPAVGLSPSLNYYDFRIEDGEITHVSNGFSGLAGWESFRAFMVGHPQFATMYESDSLARLGSEETNMLWREHSARFLANRFYLAFTSGDYEAARFMASSNNVLPRGLDLVIQAFDIEIAEVECETLAPALNVRCTTTQTDSFTRHLSPDYTYANQGTISIANNRVTAVQSVTLDDPVYDAYMVWLDETSPSEWEGDGCRAGGWLERPVCVAIIVDTDNIDAWLATDPDLSSIGG